MKCVDNWKKNGLRGTVVAFVGFGKTLIGIVAMRRVVNANPKCKCILIVPSEPVLKQWKAEIIKCGLSGNVEIYTKDTASKIYDKLDCDFLVIDEVHEIVTKSRVNILKIGYKLIMCLTATLSRLDGRDSIITRYAPVCDEVTIEEGIKNKWTSRAKIFKVLIDIDLNEYNELTKKFKNLFSWFNYRFDVPVNIVTNKDFRYSYVDEKVSVEYGATGSEYKAVFKSVFGEVMNNAKEFMEIVNKRKEFIYHHPKKIEVANRIIEARKDKKGMTFWNSIEDAMKVGYGKTYASPTKENKLTKKKCNVILDEFKASKSGVINTVKALNTGFNCPEIEYGIMGGFDSSKTRSKQANGRIVRIDDLTKNKEAEIFYLILRGTKDEDWAELSLNGQATLTMLESDLYDYLEGKEVMFLAEKKNKNATRY